MFREKLGLEVVKNKSEMLIRSQTYINYDDKMVAEEIEKSKFINKGDDNEHPNDGDKKKESCARFSVCISLNKQN
jgi:hypothetical protein